MTKRPRIVLVGMAVQTSIAAILAGAVGLFSLLIYSLRNSATPSHGLKTALIIALPLAVAAFVASWGMWKQRAWGWWTALVFNALAVLAMVPDLINGEPDLGDFAGAALVVVSLALLLPAQVRKHFLRSSHA
jgi:hypothetical protein